MPLASGDILQDALYHGYAVPAFSVHSHDMIEAVLQESEQEQHPVMLQIGQRAIRNGQMRALADSIRYFAQKVQVPVVIHLDHCHVFDQAAQALQAGFTSCMMDASALPLKDNVAQTLEVVRLCHAVGVPVEGELGAIGGVEDDVEVADDDVVYTSVEAAVEFVARTSVDSLAVAIGSAHGMYKREPKLDLNRLADIHAGVSIPLVLHGGSGIPADQIRRTIGLGIAKINFDTELRIAYMHGLRAASRLFPDDPFSAIQHAGNDLRTTVRDKIACCRGQSA